MKKILLLLLTISFFSANSFAQQEWVKIYNEGDIKVEMTTVDCNPNNRMVPYSYVLLKYTNTSGEVIDFNFEIKKWYNGVYDQETTSDSGDSPVIKTIQYF